MPGRDTSQRRTDRAIGRDAAGHDQMPPRGMALAKQRRRPPGPIGQRLGDGALERGGEIGTRLCIARRQCLDREAHCRLQPGEGEIAAWPTEHRPRQLEPRGIAGRRRCLDRRTAGIAEPYQLGAFVEGLADRVVDRRAEPPVLPTPSTTSSWQCPPEISSSR